MKTRRFDRLICKRRYLKNASRVLVNNSGQLDLDACNGDKIRNILISISLRSIDVSRKMFIIGIIVFLDVYGGERRGAATRVDYCLN